MSEIADVLEALADDLTVRKDAARADMKAAEDRYRVAAYGGEALALEGVIAALRSAALKAREQSK